MNKTVNINLAGVFFHIDEDAYLKLSRYLEAIKRSFTDSQGRSEIISDITSTGQTLKANNLRILTDGKILKSQACMLSSKISSRKKDIKKIIKMLLKN